MSDHLHYNIFMAHILSNTSVTKNVYTWYVGETSISTSSLLERLEKYIFSMSRFSSWLESNFLTGLKKNTQKCSNSNSYFPACHWRGGRAFPQANSFSLSCSATRCCYTKPGLPASLPMQSSLPLPRHIHLVWATQQANAAGQRHPATGVRCSLGMCPWVQVHIQSIACENAKMASHVPLALGNSRKCYLMMLPGSNTKQKQI